MKHAFGLLMVLTFVGAFAADRVVLPSYQERIQCDDPITNVLVTLHTFSSYHELKTFARKNHGITDPVDGYSDCLIDKENNIAWCDIYVMEPKIVDGWNIWTIGHELFHGICGPEYHK